MIGFPFIAVLEVAVEFVVGAVGSCSSVLLREAVSSGSPDELLCSTEPIWFSWSNWYITACALVPGRLSWSSNPFMFDGTPEWPSFSSTWATLDAVSPDADLTLESNATGGGDRPTDQSDDPENVKYVSRSGN